MEPAATGPDAGRGAEGELIRKARAGVVQPQPVRLEDGTLTGRHQLEIDAMLGKQTQAAVPGIFDRDDPFGASEQFQQQHGPWQTLAQCLRVERRFLPSVEDRAQLGPSACTPGSAKKIEQATNPLGGTNQASR
jgi:hypothetical protein